MARKWTEARQRRFLESQLRRTGANGLAGVIERNICTIVDLRHDAETKKSREERVADRITAFSGSMMFVYIHAAFFALWIGLNMAFGRRAFDPYPFNFLTMTVSLEAIFLSTFVLVSQNRMAAVSDERADLDLQINLLAEYEITRMLKLVDKIAEKVGVDLADKELRELEENVKPEDVLKVMEERQKEKLELREEPSANEAGSE